MDDRAAPGQSREPTHRPKTDGRRIRAIESRRPGDRPPPHARRGEKRHALPDEQAVDGAPAVLALDRTNRVVAATPAARWRLAELGPLAPGWRAGPDLPIAVQTVVAALDRALRPGEDRDGHLAPRLLVRGRSGGWLTLYGALTEPVDGRPSERLVVIAPSQPEEIAWQGAAAFGLSRREEEVVRLVARGCSTREIADELFIAEHTVQRHLSNVFDKVGVRSRSALVKRLFFDDLLPSVGDQAGARQPVDAR